MFWQKCSISLFKIDGLVRCTRWTITFVIWQIIGKCILQGRASHFLKRVKSILFKRNVIPLCATFDGPQSRIVDRSSVWDHHACLSGFFHHLNPCVEDMFGARGSSYFNPSTAEDTFAVFMSLISGHVCNNCLCNNHGLCNINRLRNKKSTAYVITTACVIKK